MQTATPLHHWERFKSRHVRKCSRGDKMHQKPIYMGPSEKLAYGNKNVPSQKEQGNLV